MLHIVAHAVVCSSGRWGGVLTDVPDEYFTYVTEHVAVVNMLHMLPYIFISGWGGCMKVPDEL